MANVKQLLKSSLDELLEAELKEFQWCLSNDHGCVSKAKMENADRLKTVDKMVSCFGPEGAVKITVDTLRKINRNHLAEELENTQKQDQKTSEIWEKNKAVRRGGWRLEDQNYTLDTFNSCNKKEKIDFKQKIEDKQGQVTIRHSEASARDLQGCQSCVDIADSDQWVQVEPSVCKNDGGSEFRISTQAGRFQCSRTRMRWVCDGDVTLHYKVVDGLFLNAELERHQFERIGPVFDVNVISGKLEEAHLPHYMCLAESDPALTDSVRLLSKRDEGISLKSVELSRYHAKILQPSFSLITLIINRGMKWEAHCDLLLYMYIKSSLFFHIYFFPENDTRSKEKVEQNERSSLLIRHPRPDNPLQMETPHILEVPGVALVHPKEGISFRTDVAPNFFKVKMPQFDDVQMNLIRQEDKKSVWTTTICKEEFLQLKQIHEEPKLNSEIDKCKFFDAHRLAFIERVTNVKSIADKLLDQRIIHKELYSEITQTNVTIQQIMRKIYDSVGLKGKRAKARFIDILQEEELYLLEDLMCSDA